MYQQLKQLGTDTAIYGISTIVGRFLNFLLVPFYTNVLAPGEFGVVSYIYSLIAFANVVYTYGMEISYMKYATSLELGTTENSTSRRQNFNTPFLSLAGTSIIFSIFLFLLAPTLPGFLSLPSNLTKILYCTAGILLCDTLSAIPFASLRLERKAKRFALIKLLNIIVNVGMNVLLLVKFNFGVEGIFLSGFVSSALTVVMLLPTIKQYFSFEIDTTLWKALLKFGLPSIPAGLAGMVLQVVDRPILKALTNDATVGIYQANYRLGIFMMLIVSMFDYAWKPFMFSVAKEENAKIIFARVLTYFTLAMASVFIVLTFFIDEIAHMSFFGNHLINERYWSGLEIVPIVLLGYVFLGMATTMSAGIYIEKKTKYNPPITMTAAAVNIAANFFLIPIIGMAGAAWATLVAYLVMAVMTYFMSQRIYPIQYEWGRLGKIALVTTVIILAEAIILAPNIEKLFKVLLIVVFFLLFGIIKFFEKGEMVVIKQQLSKALRSTST
ncbi:MAG: polysaccharide biosynthesis C-terminal domain-containing protein [Ignavibacteriae bacterium]|nr:polysaccharide biosynthesis C-terminal domain-containing protein [Ignavibacteriota bacterium]